MSQSAEISNGNETVESAGPLLTRSVARQLNCQHIDSIAATQRDALSRFEKTNEMLTNCNNLSVIRLNAAMKELQPYRQTLTEMKRDLDAIFRRIRTYKQSFAQLYPEAFAAAQQMVVPHKTSDDEDELEKKNDQSVEKISKEASTSK